MPILPRPGVPGHAPHHIGQAPLLYLPRSTMAKVDEGWCRLTVGLTPLQRIVNEFSLCSPVSKPVNSDLMQWPSKGPLFLVGVLRAEMKLKNSAGPAAIPHHDRCYDAFPLIDNFSQDDSH